MCDAPLARSAGPIALVAGGFFAAVHLVMLPMMETDRIALLRDPLFRVVNAAYFFAFVGLLLALVAVHGRQHRAAGTFGVVGFCAAVVVGGVVGFNAGLPPYGVPIGLAVAALGGWLTHHDRATRVTGGTAAPR